MSCVCVRVLEWPQKLNRVSSVYNLKDEHQGIQGLYATKEGFKKKGWEEGNGKSLCIITRVQLNSVLADLGRDRLGSQIMLQKKWENHLHHAAKKNYMIQ